MTYKNVRCILYMTKARLAPRLVVCAVGKNRTLLCISDTPNPSLLP